MIGLLALGDGGCQIGIEKKTQIKEVVTNATKRGESGSPASVRGSRKCGHSLLRLNWTHKSVVPILQAFSRLLERLSPKGVREPC